jgi:hypothetical protein
MSTRFTYFLHEISGILRERQWNSAIDIPASGLGLAELRSWHTAKRNFDSVHLAQGIPFRQALSKAQSRTSCGHRNSCECDSSSSPVSTNENGPLTPIFQLPDRDKSHLTSGPTGRDYSLHLLSTCVQGLHISDFRRRSYIPNQCSCSFYDLECVRFEIGKVNFPSRQRKTPFSFLTHKTD